VTEEIPEATTPAPEPGKYPLLDFPPSLPSMDGGGPPGETSTGKRKSPGSKPKSGSRRPKKTKTGIDKQEAPAKGTAQREEQSPEGAPSPPPVESGRTTEEEGRPLVGPLKVFWEQCIRPYRANFEAQGVWDIAEELIELIEQHGHVPSVVLDNKDTESMDLLSVRDNLAKVSLKEHTYSVALHIVEIVKDQYQEPVLLRYMDGWSFEEIREKLDLSEGALRGLLERGIVKLRTMLRPLYEEIQGRGIIHDSIK